jgi:hypothetical protein
MLKIKHDETFECTNGIAIVKIWYVIAELRALCRTLTEAIALVYYIVPVQ